MDTSGRGKSGASSESHKANKALTTYDQKNTESLSTSLMYEIRETCQELKTVGILSFKPGEDIEALKKQGDDLKQKIASLCHDLELAKSTVTQAIGAMERNARKLEGQHLNDPEEEQKLRRAAQAAWNEVERLGKLINEIEEVLNHAAEAISESEELIGRSTSEHKPIHFNEKKPHSPDLDNILAGLDAARNIPSATQEDHTSPASKYEQSTPLLGNADFSDLETSLGKIPTPSVGSVEIHSDPYTRGLYIDDIYSGREELSYEPYDSAAGSTAIGAQNGPITAQAGFDGSYKVHGPGGMAASFQPAVLGDW